MLSLSNANTAGINFDLLFGNVSMPDCSIGDNAQGSNALEMTGFLTSVSAYTATVYGGINSGFFNAFNFTVAPAKNSNFITPDPYACPGTECRTMPTATTPVAITPVTTIGTVATLSTVGTTALPGTCSGAAITKSGAIPAGCSKGISVGSGTVALTTAACTTSSPCTIYTSSATPGRST